MLTDARSVLRPIDDERHIELGVVTLQGEPETKWCLRCAHMGHTAAVEPDHDLSPIRAVGGVLIHMSKATFQTPVEIVVTLQLL